MPDQTKGLNEEIELTLLLRNNRLKKLRLAKGFTQKELGNLLGLSNQVIGCAEKFSGICLEKQAKIAAFFGVDREWLFPAWAMGAFRETRITREIPKEGLLASSRETISRLMLPDPVENAQQKELASGIQEVLKTLSMRERAVIQLRNALGEDQRGWTYAEIGKKFGITRERVRQVEHKAMKKLKHPIRSRLLNKLTGDEAG